MCRLRLAVLPLALAGALLTGCGDKRDAYTKAETEGLYLAAGGLKYQVQLSRGLNPSLVEDRQILSELPAAERRLEPDQLWFGVWMRVENDGSSPRQTAQSFEIKDSQGQAYEPLEVDRAASVVAYEPTRLGGDETYPESASLAAQSGPKDAAVLLFKLSRQAYYNRPLELEILSNDVPLRTQARVELDL